MMPNRDAAGTFRPAGRGFPSGNSEWKDNSRELFRLRERDFQRVGGWEFGLWDHSPRCEAIMDRMGNGLDDTEILRERLARLRHLWAGLLDPADESRVDSPSSTSGLSPAEALPDDLTHFRGQVADLLRLVRSEDPMADELPAPPDLLVARDERANPMPVAPPAS